ncbi:MAG: hypothetical protein IPK75_20340 [Acidobacteria bacterium]|nr:hypothetical protein [Acidobacteriota bacterium]
MHSHTDPINEILAPLRNLRSRPRQGALAECASLIRTCQDIEQARAAVAEILRNFDRWPGLATFRDVLAKHTGQEPPPDAEPKQATDRERAAFITQLWREVGALQRPDENSLEAATWRRIRAMKPEDRDDLIEACYGITAATAPYHQTSPASRARSIQAVMLAAAGAAWSTNGQQLQTWQTPDYIKNPPPILCQQCKDTGVRQAGAEIEWCTCQKGKLIRRENPQWLELCQRSLTKTTAKQPEPKQPPAPEPAAPRRIIDQAICPKCHGTITAWSDLTIDPCNCSTNPRRVANSG